MLHVERRRELVAEIEEKIVSLLETTPTTEDDVTQDEETFFTHLRLAGTAIVQMKQLIEESL